MSLTAAKETTSSTLKKETRNDSPVDRAPTGSAPGKGANSFIDGGPSELDHCQDAATYIGCEWGPNS